MKYPIDWNNDKSIRDVFSYQTRIGIAPKFGSRPIAWYQSIQCSAHDMICKLAEAAGAEGGFDVRKRGYQIEARIEGMGKGSLYKIFRREGGLASCHTGRVCQDQC